MINFLKKIIKIPKKNEDAANAFPFTDNEFHEDDYDETNEEPRQKKRKRNRKGINVDKIIDLVMMRELDKKREKEF